MIVEPTWLGNLAAPLSDTQWAGTAGRTLLDRSFAPPSWLALEGRYNLGSLLGGVFDLGKKNRLSAPHLTAQTWPSGGMYLRSTVVFELTLDPGRVARTLAKTQNLGAFVRRGREVALRALRRSLPLCFREPDAKRVFPDLVLRLRALLRPDVGTGAGHLWDTSALFHHLQNDWNGAAPPRSSVDA